MRKDYIKRLTELMRENKLDAMLISPSEELLFFTGLDLMLCERMQGLFVTAGGDCFYVCNDIYAGEVDEGVQGQLPIFSWHDNEGMFKAVDAAFAKYHLNGKTIAVNTAGQVCNILDIAERTGARFVNGRPLLEEVRIRKSHEELDNMRKSAAVADSVFEPVCRLIRPGVTEAQVRDLMTEIMTQAGGSNLDVIVASGPNSSYPHYSRYDRTIAEGDCIVLDWGCAINGLMSDMSRTVFVGSITREMAEIYELVNRSQLTAQNAVKEGAWIPDLDRIAREVLDEKHLAHTLINRLGHGIGYSVHEGPYISQLNKRKLERGMCFSIEPGVYLPGRFGMRVENIMCVNEEGQPEVLNKSDRSLRVLPG
ncbi:MAG: aminopeptidase P family protein [Firmicutes bacterium]|nr:aminopeptidase P family protein [Bacillota bacterium]